MACLEFLCPVVECDAYVSDNDPSPHYCPVHGERMIRHWDERGQAEEEKGGVDELDELDNEDVEGGDDDDD